MPIQNVFNFEDSVFWEFGAMLVMNGSQHFKNHTVFGLQGQAVFFWMPSKGQFLVELFYALVEQALQMFFIGFVF